MLIFVGGLLVESSLQIQGDPIDWVNQSSPTIKKIDTIKEQTKSSTELGIYVASDNVFDQETVDFVHNFAYQQRRERTFDVDGKEKPALLTASSIVTTMSGIINVPGATPRVTSHGVPQPKRFRPLGRWPRQACRSSPPHRPKHRTAPPRT